MQYWLMKSEPETFGINDLAKRPQQTEPWDGVRNYQVRNWLRDTMQVGDLAFFYHSNCKIPGITGIVKIVTAGYPDTTAFDPHSQYYDPKSKRETPRWYRVDVKLVQQFQHIIPLTELKQIPELKHMRLLQKGSRLSITPVTAKEWEQIVMLAQ